MQVLYLHLLTAQTSINVQVFLETYNIVCHGSARLQQSKTIPAVIIVNVLVPSRLLFVYILQYHYVNFQ